MYTKDRGFAEREWKRQQPQKDTQGYTKGEWKAHKNALGTWTIATELTRIGEADRHFNAHLIAAAPELFEACKAVLDNWGTRDLSDDIPLERQLTQAIAKVEEK